MALLIQLHRRLQGIVDLIGARPLARKIFRFLFDLHYRGGRLARSTQNGRTWWLDPEVALRGELQEIETIQWLRDVVKPGMTVIDVGANVGQMTLESAALVGPAGKVVAIEPHPGNLALLRRHVSANGYSEIVAIVAAACADRDSPVAPLRVYGAAPTTVGSGHKLEIIPPHPADATLPEHIIDVPLVSLDRLCKEMGVNPDVVKIDVEGAELLVLRGAQKTLAQSVPAVQVGFHPFAFSNPANAASTIAELMRTLGYQAMSPIASFDQPSDLCFMARRRAS